MNSIIITGINGFVGEHLAREMKSKNFKVYGVGHDANVFDKVKDLVDEYIQCDLLDEDAVRSKLPVGEAHAIVHLAGLAAVGLSFDQPKRFMTDNGIMTQHLLQSTLDNGFSGRMVVVSSGALYDPRQPLPLNEDSKTASSSPYAVGKLLVEHIVEYYRTRGVDAITVRPFNHIGPGQGPGFLLPDLYEQLEAARSSGIIKVGNLTTKRDYTDVRDIVKAYSQLALSDTLEHGLYNICSGKSLSGNDILEMLKQAARITDVKVDVDQARIRPTDIAEITGDASRLKNELGWEPSIAIEQTVKDFVDAKKKTQ